MNRSLRRVLPWLAILWLACGAATVQAQVVAKKGDRLLQVSPGEATLKAGDSVQLEAKVTNLQGDAQDTQIFFFTRDRHLIDVTPEGLVTAKSPGQARVTARTAGARDERLSINITIQVAYPPLEKIEFLSPPHRIYAGATVTLETRAVLEGGMEHDALEVSLRSATPQTAEVDPFGHLTALAPGSFTIIASAEGQEAELSGQVLANPVAEIVLSCPTRLARTGDVLQFEAEALTPAGATVENAPIQYSLFSQPDDALGNAATGQIRADGRFVAQKAGQYTILASCGTASDRYTVKIVPRDIEGKLELIGRGQVQDVHTSDLWVWEGVDGRDYAVTGTWGADGDAIFWDVTDPSNIERISSVRVDARTVNDVKVSEDGRLCIISREGASNRRNGIVLIDVENPREPKIISTYDENLTGGVHNLFIYRNHVYALSAGRRYDIINIEDPKNPHTVGKFELEEDGHSIHDVWVEDGIAYSSNWRHGVQMVDVGNGIKGGTPENPVRIGEYAYPSGWNHAAFPYKDKVTGKFYIIAGDEAFPYGLNLTEKPTYPRGWIHFIDFTDPENPEEVARYEVPEAGTHNLWVEDDLLYVAYYNGGVRVVDISGDLMGDLYHQGREIAWYLPTDHEGVVPNAPMTWGPQPHKGHIFFSDWNSGLWAVKLEMKDQRSIGQ
ncbi:MAG: Ig-like domain-containing protein [Planctomycetota bacterium]